MSEIVQAFHLLFRVPMMRRIRRGVLRGKIEKVSTDIGSGFHIIRIYKEVGLQLDYPYLDPPISIFVGVTLEERDVRPLTRCRSPILRFVGVRKLTVGWNLQLR